MTKEEALAINSELVKKGKMNSYSNSSEWKWKRCALCMNQIQDGDEYITFIPMDYKHYVKTESKLLHVNCLDLRDRGSYNYNRKKAHDSQPLLTESWIYDIIQGKESDNG